MQLSGTYAFNAPIDRVWTLLNDPDVIAACLPGCDQLEPLGDDRYRASLSMAVAAISGQYSGTVALRDKQPPRSYRLLVDGSGKAGFVKGEATVTLAEPSDAPGTTMVTVSGDGQVGGLMARVGQRLLGSVSQMMLDRFFADLRAKAEVRSV
ncbi:MAG: CoxG family protein [Vicinamibacterales bacterium]